MGCGTCRSNTYQKDQFEEDIAQVVSLIRKATGLSPIGYRAPGMTLLPVADWATPILKSHGFLYSSSMPAVPSRQHRYRVARPDPFYWPCGLEELPASTQHVFGVRIPICGSIYARYLPGPLTRLAMEKYFRESGRPLFYYFHPFEVFPETIPRWLLRKHWSVRMYLFGCSGFRRKIEWLLANHQCVSYNSARANLTLRAAS